MRAVHLSQGAVCIVMSMMLHAPLAMGTDVQCALDSIEQVTSACDFSQPCFNGRGNRATGHECDGTQTGPCSRDTNDPTGYLVTAQTPYFTIPVVFHVVKHATSGAGSIPLSRINSQILAFNQDFNVRPHGIQGFPEPTGTSAHLEFVLAGLDSASNTSWYRNMGAGCAAEDSATAALHWDPTQYFNVYTTATSPPYSTYPWACSESYLDGIRLVDTLVGRTAPNGGIGRVPVHEAGHWLGLYHTQTCFHCAGPDTCYTHGDLICDLNQDGSIGVCTSVEFCTGKPSEPQDYMGNRGDNCVNRFSAEQVARMRCALQTYRPDGYLGIDESSIEETVTTFCYRGNHLIRAVISWDTNLSTDAADTLQVWPPAVQCGAGTPTVATASPNGTHHSVTFQSGCLSGTFKYTIRSRKGILGTRAECRTFSNSGCPTCPLCDDPCEFE